MQRGGGQFFNDFAGNNIVTKVFLRRKVMDYCVYLGSFEVVDREMDI
jgi:hypothetical protein